MKKILAAVAALLITAVCVSAQTSRSLYKKYSGQKGVSAVYISPAMFRLIGHIPDIEMNDGDVNLSPIIRSLSGMYILNTEDSVIGDKIISDVEKLLDAGNFELLMEASEEGELTRMFTVGDDRSVKSFVLLAIEPDETSFISFEGDIPRSEFEKVVAGAAQ